MIHNHLVFVIIGFVIGWIVGWMVRGEENRRYHARRSMAGMALDPLPPARVVAWIPRGPGWTPARRYGREGVLPVPLTGQRRPLNNRTARPISIASSIASGTLSGMTNTQCARCHRGAPPQDSDDFLHWEVLGTDDLAVVCPGCITGEEQQAMDEDMMDLAEKVRENRLRRAAGRQGLRLSKSRRRDPRAIDYGGYMIVDTSTNAVVAGAYPIAYNMNLDEVEDFLLGDTQVM